MKIYATPCGAVSQTIELEMLKQFFNSSTPRLHEWCDEPAKADIIFLTNAQQNWGRDLRKHPLPHQFPEKCFALSEQWEPPFLLAGIYANAPRTTFGRGRFRTGSYALHHPDFHNAYVEAYDYTTERANRAPDLLASFLGRNCHPVRAHLFDLKFSSNRILVQDTSTFNAFTHSPEGKLEKQRSYFDVCMRSKFILCPRGAGPNSIRLFEAMRLGIAPVIISDAWLPCEGPDWKSFALFVAEKDIGRVEEILTAAEPEFTDRGALARQAYEAFFSPASYFNYLVNAAISARKARVIPERIFVSLWPAAHIWRGARRRLLRLTKGT